MLRITDIKIETYAKIALRCRSKHFVRTASDRQGESLAKAKISCGSWQVTTSDQINNLYTASSNHLLNTRS
jgi:hypothetical protein